MSEQKPLIQEIHDRFDHFGTTIGNSACTSSIKIACNRQGYSVTAYPQNTYGYEGFTMEITAPEGIFGDAAPTKVEMSREKDEGMRINFDEVIAEGRGSLTAFVKVEPHAAREGLVLPGDPGFELFDQLHSELAARRSVVREAIGTLGIDAAPLWLQYTSQNWSVGHYDHDNKLATHERATLIEVDARDDAIIDNVNIQIKLDGSRTVPMLGGHTSAVFPPEYPMVFCTGKGEANWESTYKVKHLEANDTALMSFAALHASFARLYR